MKRLMYSLALALAANAFAAQQLAPAPKQQEENRQPVRLAAGSLGVYEALTTNGTAYATNESSVKPRKNPWDPPHHNVDNLFGLSAEAPSSHGARTEQSGSLYRAPSPMQERDYKSRFTNPPPGVFTRPAIPGSAQTPSSEESRRGTNLFAPVKKLIDKTLAPAAGTNNSNGGQS